MDAKMIKEERQAALDWHLKVLLAYNDYQEKTSGYSLVIEDYSIVLHFCAEQRIRLRKYYSKRNLAALQKKLKTMIKRCRLGGQIDVLEYIYASTGIMFDDPEIYLKHLDNMMPGQASPYMGEINKLQAALRLPGHYAPDAERIYTYGELLKDMLALLPEPKPDYSRSQHVVNDQIDTIISDDHCRKLTIHQYEFEGKKTKYAVIYFPGSSGPFFNTTGIDPLFTAKWKDPTTLEISLDSKSEYPEMPRRISSFDDVIKIEYRIEDRLPATFD